MVGRATLALLFGACGFSITPTGSGLDASAIDSSVDAPPEPPDAFVPLGPWSTPVRITELNTAFSEDDPSLTADLLEFYFGSDRSGGSGAEDIWMSRRSAVGQPWSAPVPVGILNTIFNETTMKIAPDGLTIAFASDRQNGYDLYIATRASRTDPWGNPEPIAELNSVFIDFAPSLSPDMRRIVFTSTRLGSEEIFFSTRPNATGTFAAPTQISELSTAVNESDPFEPDSTTMYFASTRNSSYDLFTTTRISTTYSAPTPIVELNTLYLDRDPWVSPNQRLIVFCSDRGGYYDLYMSTR